VFYSNFDSDVPQLQHAWVDGWRWHRDVVSRRTRAFELAGRGTLRIPISRPDVVIGADDAVFVIYRSDEHGDRMVATRLAAPDYVHEPSDTRVLWDGDIGFCEPVIDRQRWLSDGILTLFIQHTEQPDGDLGILQRMDPVLLVDLELT
jgi:hypothetical protein